MNAKRPAETKEAIKPGAAQKPPMYADHIKIYPRDVKGTFRNLKWLALVILMGIYWIVPWIRYDRGAGAPDQLLLLDIAGRRGYIGPLEIWPQEVYYVTGLLVLAAIGLFFVTSLLGRVWCGFACWQTVWMDLYVLVERLIEGDRNKRLAFDKAPMSLNKAARKIVKHLAWLLIAAATGGAFIFFFIDAPTGAREIFTGQASGWTYSVIGILTSTTYMLAGWAREQVCIYMCPWPRFQAAMFDEDSLIVTYEEWRGEPRAKYKPGEDFSKRSHCVDCGMCVQVCPTGVDIRAGNQMACIGCALCVDACNSVMERFGLPPGLVTYDSTRNQVLRSQGKPAKKRLIRPRTIVYTALMLAVILVITISLSTRAHIEINVLRDRAPLFVTLSDGAIRNGYTYKVLNMEAKAKRYTLALDGVPGAQLTVIGYQEAWSNAVDIDVKPDAVGAFKVYVRAERGALKETSVDLKLLLTDRDTGETVIHHTVFIGPGG